MENILNDVPRAATDKSKGKKRAEKIVVTAVKYLLLAAFSIFFIFPFVIMICYSFLTDSESLQQVLISPSRTFYVGAYIRILQNTKYLGYLKNSVITSVLAAIGSALCSSLCAYGFAKLEFKGKNTMFGIVLATMMIPSIVTQIPLFRVYQKLGFMDTLLPLWLPACFGGGATNIFLMTQFMRGIPNDLNNAAKIDGAGSFRIFAVMMIPLCLPIFLYVLVTAFMGTWNDYMTPLMFVTNPAKFTLSLGIMQDYGKITASSTPNYSMAAGFIMMLPCLVLFFAFQKYLIEGVTVTGLKG